MIKITFDILGNQENRKGNPIPYTRTTQAGKFSEKYKRYLSWKSYVVAAYLDASFPDKKITRENYGDVHDLLQKKPIGKGYTGRVTANIRFADEHHCDPDNVVKGILDALFQDDKHINVTTFHACRDTTPGVKVQIDIEK